MLPSQIDSYGSTRYIVQNWPLQRVCTHGYMCILFHVCANVHVGVYLGEVIHMCRCLRKPEVKFKCLPNHLSWYVLRQALSLNLELISLVSLVSQWAPGICLFVSSHHSMGFKVLYGHWRSELRSPSYSQASTLLTKPVPQLPLQSFLKVIKRLCDVIQPSPPLWLNRKCPPQAHVFEDLHL